ncbi:TonB-dependent receptor [Candidatus Methylopumilus universalis]|uniref:TonB-dependent receptor n=1 Tax=Candidatus Methylopumilus universalis TaxID=2588536 RepID=UPI001123AEDE|nr:TonB-dependent receptor [Candidatus Methylopumilus universalis]QDC88723.1 TonB-dependent receptor [Candidatus Methylopumilus universalis]QDC90015.1 TonB-dependent receptor [Candidatus Methylopumilus universalis]
MKKIILPSLLVTQLFTANVFAETAVKPSGVVVTANRFSSTDFNANQSIKIISRDDIDNSPYSSIPDLLRSQAGIKVSSQYGNQGIDAIVDMRGFGESAIGNTLILIDGQRLNNVDSSSIQWSSIPLSNIDHIEILPGSGGVLFGDKASGGVINIVTNKSGKNSSSIKTTLGSYDFIGLDAYLSGSNKGFYYNSGISSSKENGYRENSQSVSNAISGRVGISSDRYDSFIDYSLYQQENGTPGAISSSVFNANPKAARFQNNFQRKDGFKVRPGLNIKISDSLEFSSEFSVSRQGFKSDNPDFPSKSYRVIDTYTFSPRIKWDHNFSGLKSSSVFGFDYILGKLNVNNFGNANQSAEDKSYGIYLQNTTWLASYLNLTSGLRSHHNEQKANQDAYTSYGQYNPYVQGETSQNKKAYEISLNYFKDNWGGYVKNNQGFRFANLDELYGYDQNYISTFYGNILKAQISKNNEIGLLYKSNVFDARVALFRTELTNEIAYNSLLGANTNYDPTLRQGLETNLNFKITEGVDVKFIYSYLDARFTSGSLDSKFVPSVPKEAGSFILGWNNQEYGKYLLQANYVGSRYFADDIQNTKDKMPQYLTLDAKATWKINEFKINLTGLNIFDKKYAQSGILNFSKTDYFYYPANGRSLYISAEYEFK